MQRGHERKLASARFGRHHLARQQRAHRVRDRIVHVQKIKVVKLGHFRHARGQRQIVRRVLEQRITGDFHFMVMNVGMGTAQANGLGVRNEVNFVVTLRQLQPQLGRDHAAASIGRIAGDADFHACPFRISARALSIRWRAGSRDSDFAWCLMPETAKERC